MEIAFPHKKTDESRKDYIVRRISHAQERAIANGNIPVKVVGFFYPADIEKFENVCKKTYGFVPLNKTRRLKSGLIMLIFFVDANGPIAISED